MTEITSRPAAARASVIDADTLDRLRAEMRGELLTPTSPGYDDARKIWNAMIERRPALIARCRGAADVVRVLRETLDLPLPVSVRGGGHNIAGNALADGGIVLDLSSMRSVHVNPKRRTARVEPGATLGDFDREAQTFGLATPLGINSTTGVAGLTLGGGYGWLSRLYGLTVDNLLSVDVVTSDGETVTASAEENGDLFWAVRGGGGNFGVVTSFEYRLHPVGPEVLAGLIVHPFDDAAELLRRYRDAVQGAPDALTAWVVMRKAPPLPFLPASVHGKEVVVIATCFAGRREDGERALRPLRAIGKPIADVVGPTPYVAWQTAFDPLLAPGARNYWKTHNFSTLHDDLADVLVKQVGRLPGPQCEIFLAHLGGAVSRLPDDSTAYMGRRAQFVMNVHARWDDASEDADLVGWAREVYQRTAPWAAAGAYVNFLTQDEQERVRSAYGDNYERLAVLKSRYDPANRLRVNGNIVPLAPARIPGEALGRVPTSAPRVT